MIVIGSNTSDNGKSHFTKDVSHFMELRQNRQIAKRSAKNKDDIHFAVTGPFNLNTKGRFPNFFRF